ncbi:MAG: hypothetical protein IT306_22595 [Chloroflexi bacterium]|nr:hypothetical protein [Chloroflexota bacterium]
MPQGTCGERGDGVRVLVLRRRQRRLKGDRGRLLSWPAERGAEPVGVGAVATGSVGAVATGSVSAVAAGSVGAVAGGAIGAVAAGSVSAVAGGVGTTGLPPAAVLAGLFALPSGPAPSLDIRPDDSDAAAATGLGWLWRMLGHTAGGRERWAELLRLAVASADRPVAAEMLNVMGQLVLGAGELTLAQACFGEALVAARAGRTAEAVVRALDGLTSVAVARGAFELARTLQDEALTIRRRLRDREGVARSLAMLGWLLLDTQGVQHAEALLEASLAERVQAAQEVERWAGQRPEWLAARGSERATVRSGQLRQGQARGLLHLGWLARIDGRRELAQTHLVEALVTDAGGTGQIAGLIGLLAQVTGEGASSIRTVAGLLIGAELHDAAQQEQADPAGYRVEAFARLALPALARIWSGATEATLSQEAGRTELAAWALCASETAAATSAPSRSADAERALLTARELEVALLIGKGYTNRRIAEELIIGERTAETHARNIREKLGMSTRAQIAAWAAVRAAG